MSEVLHSYFKVHVSAHAAVLCFSVLTYWVGAGGCHVLAFHYAIDQYCFELVQHGLLIKFIIPAP